MTVTRLIKCPTCIGMGYCAEGDKCSTCEGTGEVPSNETIVDEPCQPFQAKSLQPRSFQRKMIT